ncbi:MAG: 3-phosphoserine/phosphohydroxythreonine transaminase [Deltaproteobacteria bacterium]|nr:3-phosphoserine/phosphohydroxythreonine transaminase [Deltaproteobacteria bacterium]
MLNFNPGPSILPAEALEEIRRNFMNFGGMSILEISHRSKEFENILEDAKALFAELMAIPKNYHILFLQGGASLQFAMVPMNLMEKCADYSLTGYWSKKALKEAKLFGEANIPFSSENSAFSRTPKPAEISLSQKSSYLHITSNNTIYGTQYHEFPETGDIPLVADMSSDILSRKIDVSKFGLIYAGAQKNLGPAGTTVVIIRDDLLKREYRKLPTMLKYSIHAESNSLYNTPPVFAVYAMSYVLKWIKKSGGIDAIEKINREKADTLYKTIDSSNLYCGTAEKSSRSSMNVTFRLKNTALENRFLDEAKKAEMAGLKGHREIGGIRASIYNAFPLDGVKKLAEFMKEFERKI